MNEILIVGISTVDAIGGPIDEFPALGGLRLFERLTVTTGGCAVNCAIALAKLGVPCDVVTRVGSDMLGDFVIAELGRNGVSTAGIVRDPAVNTAFTFVAVASNGEHGFIHTKGTNATLRRADVPAELLRGRKLILVNGAMLMDTLDGEQTASLLADARAAGATTLLDTVNVVTAPPAEWRRRIGPALPHLDYFVPSLPEARAISGLDDPAQIAKSFQAQGCRNVAIKLGEQGAFCRDVTGRETHVPPFHVNADRVVDTTGAGDCWCAGFLIGLRDNLPIAESARLGNAVAAHCIQATGATAGVKTLDEIRDFMVRSKANR